MTKQAAELLNFLKSRKEEFIAFLKQLVTAETPSTDPKSIEPILKAIRHEYSEIDYTAIQIPGKSSGGQLLLKPQIRKRHKPVQLLLGHCDTVWPKGTIKKMPFEQNGNILTGPGIYDMKAGLAITLFALKAARHLGKEPPATPIVFINSDEELSSGDSKKNIIRLAKCASRVFVMEPSLGSDGKIKTQRKGVGHFEITVTGKSAHAGLEPESGASAILGLSEVVQQLFALNDPESGTTVNVGTIQGGERSNVIAATGKASVDVRIRTKQDGLRIEKAIRALDPQTPGIKVHIEGGIERLPMRKKRKNQKLWIAAKKAAAELDLNLREGFSGGASDGNFTNLYSPTIDGLGAVGEGAHADHERIYIKESLERCALLSLLILSPLDEHGA